MDEQKRLTDTLEILQDLDGGNFLEKLNRALTEVAGGVMDQKVKGKIVISMEMSPIGASAQVNVVHNLDYTLPTDYGSVRETDKTSTVMQVHTGGKLSFEPENQVPLFDRRGETHRERNDQS